MIVKTIRYHLEVEKFHSHLKKYSRQMLTLRSKLLISFLAYHPLCAIFDDRCCPSNAKKDKTKSVLCSMHSSLSTDCLFQVLP